MYLYSYFDYLSELSVNTTSGPSLLGEKETNFVREGLVVEFWRKKSWSFSSWSSFTRRILRISSLIFCIDMIPNRWFESKDKKYHNPLQNVGNVQNYRSPLGYISFFGQLWNSKSNQFKEPSQSHCNEEFQKHIIPKLKKYIITLYFLCMVEWIRLNWRQWVCGVSNSWVQN